jgi:hydrogenase maturation factor
VALFGAQPQFCTINLLGPPLTKPEVFYRVMDQACGATDELKVSIVTGHTGTYEGLSTLVGVCTAYGVVDRSKLVTPGGAKPGDHILCTKSIGLETVVNFALTHTALAERVFRAARTRELAKLVSMQSCVKEAMLLAKIGGVHAMHDTTEGGLTAALNEMAEASKAGFRIEQESIPVKKETQALRELFKLSDEQVLSMSSTGTMLAAISPEAKDKVEAELCKNGVEACFLGVFTKNKRRILVKDGKETQFPRKAEDPYDRILSGKL